VNILEKLRNDAIERKNEDKKSPLIKKANVRKAKKLNGIHERN